MNSREDAAFRLDFAKGYLARAESDVQEERWDSCLANLQEAVENAGKSILTPNLALTVVTTYLAQLIL